MVMESCAGVDNQFREAQALVDKTMAKYPDIVRLTI
jgi:hypothetical protein